MIFDSGSLTTTTNSLVTLIITFSEEHRKKKESTHHHVFNSKCLPSNFLYVKEFHSSEVVPLRYLVSSPHKLKFTSAYNWISNKIWGINLIQWLNTRGSSNCCWRQVCWILHWNKRIFADSHFSSSWYHHSFQTWDAFRWLRAWYSWPWSIGGTGSYDCAGREWGPITTCSSTHRLWTQSDIFRASSFEQLRNTSRKLG